MKLLSTEDAARATNQSARAVRKKIERLHDLGIFVAIKVGKNWGVIESELDYLRRKKK